MKQLTIAIRDIDKGLRFRESLGDLTEFKADIKTNGLINPITVKVQSGGGYLLLAGERRLTACNELCMEDIPCNVYPEDIQAFQIRCIELSENLQRKDMEWKEEIALKSEIHNLHIKKHGHKVGNAKDATGWNATKTAALLGEAQPNISRDLKLAKALEGIEELGACKTKSDAMKLLKKYEKITEANVKSKRIDEKKADKGVDRVRKELTDNYIVNDAFVGMKGMKDGSMHFVEIDPPYAIDLHSNKKHAEGNAVMADYQEAQREEYLGFLHQTLSEGHRVLRDDGWLCIWFAYEWYEYVKIILDDLGFKTTTVPCIWTKPNGQCMQPNYLLANCHEPFLYVRKTAQARIKTQGMRNVFNYKPVAPDKKIHPTERPIALIEALLETFTNPGDRVLVPFLGSGNTLLACANLNRFGIGFDLSQVYKDQFKVRVFDSEPKHYRSHAEKAE